MLRRGLAPSQTENLGGESVNLHLERRSLRCHLRAGPPRMLLAFFSGCPVPNSAILVVLGAVMQKKRTSCQQNNQATGARTGESRRYAFLRCERLPVKFLRPGGRL